MKLNIEDFISEYEYKECIKKMEVHLISVFNILNNEETYKTEKGQMLLAAMNTLDNDREKAVFISAIISYYEAVILEHIRYSNAMAQLSEHMMDIMLSQDGDCQDDIPDSPKDFS